MSSPASRFPLPCSHAGWRILALGLAELPSERLPSADRPALKQLKDATWDIASYAAFWRTVQLPSLGPGLLPGLVVMLLLVPQIARGNLGPSPRPSDPFIL